MLFHDVHDLGIRVVEIDGKVIGEPAADPRHQRVVARVAEGLDRVQTAPAKIWQKRVVVVVDRLRRGRVADEISRWQRVELPLLHQVYSMVAGVRDVQGELGGQLPLNTRSEEHTSE